MEECIDNVTRWMVEGKPTIKDERTVYLGPNDNRRQSRLRNYSVISQSWLSLSVGPCEITPDSSISMVAHVTKLCKSAFYIMYPEVFESKHTRNISRNPPYGPSNQTFPLTHIMSYHVTHVKESFRSISVSVRTGIRFSIATDFCSDVLCTFQTTSTLA